ncbi:IS1380 family transposase [Gelidibacter japonicus]|uniref:IS1380 family transposase n=1 Tax=Gelidibacter japonicus TaxID=1962232 RepID=UPI0013D71B58|nr:IS1380 family transposase [Gelidibacter japonicus]
MTKVKTKTAKHQKVHQTSLFDLSNFGNKRVEVQFTTEQISTDGGLLFLKEVDKNIGLMDRIVSCLEDGRHQSYVKHDLKSLINQRVMQIAAGYEDANDCNDLRGDGVLKVCCDKEDSLSAQPTMSWFENSISNKELYRISRAFVDQFVSSYQKPPKAIVLDCDDTNAQTYGDQQLSLFNTYYGGYCFMPLHIYEGFSGRLITSILKPGRRSKSLDVSNVLKRLIDHLRKRWPDTLIILRGDGHFCSKEFMDWAENEEKIGFVTGLAGNQLLHKKACTTIESAKREFKTYGKPVKRYHSFSYRAGSWEYHQRVVAKVEVSEKGTNVRYVVTNMRCIRTKSLYENAYCARGAAELRIKDHKTYLKSDRMSCNSFKANQFRLFLHSAAYVLIHSLQKEALAATDFCRSTMKTIQLKIIKIATRVKILKTKVKIEFPKQFPEKQLFQNLLLMFGILRI